MHALAAALAKSKRPALVVGPAVDRAQAVDLMVQVAEKAKAAVWVSPFSSRCSFPERHPQFAGFLHASPGQLSDALREHDLVVVIGAPVFTFHVEGHASIFDGATPIFQITDDPTAAAVTPSGTSIIATMKPALTMLLELLPETKREAFKGRAIAAAAESRRSDPGRIPDAHALDADAGGCRAGRGSAVASAADAQISADARTGQFLSPWPAAASAMGCRRRSASRSAVRIVRTVCLIGDGSAMYSIQALWTAAQRKLPLTVVVINNAGYGAMRSFSQVMQVRNVPGLELPGIDFVRSRKDWAATRCGSSKAAELAGALARGLAHDGVSLIEVMVDSAVPLLYGKKD